MVTLDLALKEDDARLPLRTDRATKLTIDTGAHGLESIKATLPLPFFQASDLYGRLSAALRAVVSAGDVLASGRCEDIAITNDGVDIEALGDWRAFSDIPYTALWSDTQLAQWRELSPADRALRLNGRYLFPDGYDGLVTALKQGMNYSQNTLGSWGYEAPIQSSRDIVGLVFRLEYNLPITYRLRVVRYDGGITLGTPTVVATVVSAGAGLNTTALYLNWAGNACDAIELTLDYNNAVAVAFAGQDGDSYVRISMLRVATSNTNTINTTLGTTIAAGVRTVTPASMARIYAGQQLYIGGANPELITVTSITPTQFTATFAQAHNLADAVNAFVIYADELATDMRDAVLAVNTNALNSSDVLIQSPGLDLLDVTYEDADMADALTDQAAEGDGVQLWEVGVAEGGLLYLRPQGDAARTWYVDASEVEAQQTLTQLINSAYATYKSPSGRTLRTVSAGDADSVTRYGMTRRTAVKADTTNATIAAQMAQNAVIAAATPIPQSEVTFDRVYTASGAVAPLYLVRAGDTFVIRNLPPNDDPAIDKLRSFRLARTSYNVLANVLKVVPESPLPELEYQLAQALPPM